MQRMTHVVHPVRSHTVKWSLVLPSLRYRFLEGVIRTSTLVRNWLRQIVCSFAVGDLALLALWIGLGLFGLFAARHPHTSSSLCPRFFPIVPCRVRWP